MAEEALDAGPRRVAARGTNASRGHEIQGTPSQAGSWDFTVEVLSGGETARKALSIAVIGTPPEERRGCGPFSLFLMPIRR